MRREGQKGALRLKTLIWLVILGSLIYVTIKVAPHFVNDFELKETMRSEARFGAAQHKSESDIRDDIFKKITELSIPVKREAIKIQTSSAFVTISVSYTVEIPLPGYVLKLDFSPSADSRTW